jgi:hypothetical protein
VPEGVLIALIGGLVAMYGVTIPLLVSARKHAKTASDQVTNSHETNLREDLDEKHEDNAGRLGRVEGKVKGLRTDVTSLGRGIRRIEDHLGIEQTIPAPTRRRR